MYVVGYAENLLLNFTNNQFLLPSPSPADRMPPQSLSTALCFSPAARQLEFPAAAISALGRAARQDKQRSGPLSPWLKP